MSGRPVHYTMNFKLYTLFRYKGFVLFLGRVSVLLKISTELTKAEAVSYLIIVCIYLYIDVSVRMCLYIKDKYVKSR